MGVGTSVPRASYSAATASGALQKILGDPEMAARAAHIGAIVRAENGAETAANEIEAAFDK
jgi:UDP:flavonoid glycosyltransferase YjiC (YdhE family)